MYIRFAGSFPKIVGSGGAAMLPEVFRVGIVGCGLIGQKRARSLGSAKLVICADLSAERARSVAVTAGAAVTESWREVIDRKDVDVIVVSTTNNMLAPISMSALQAGKHVLVEKPGAMNVRELDELMQVARDVDRLVRVGFNHRYHPALI